jgi:hypothetical protein
VRADSADFGKSLQFETLSTHSDEFARGRAYSEIGTHFTGTIAEESGESESSKLEHLMGVGAGKWEDTTRGIWCRAIFWQKHLQARKSFQAVKFRDSNIAIGDKPDRFRKSEQRVEVLHGCRSGFSDGGEGDDVGGIAAGKDIADGELAMLGVEGAPNGVSE